MEARAMSIREQGWLQTIQTAAKSGQSTKAWCAQNGIAESTFYRWKHRLREKALGCLWPEPSEATQIEDTALADHPVFAQLTCAGTTESKEANRAQALFRCPSSVLRIRSGDFTLEFGTELSEEELSKVMRAVRNAW